MGTDDAHFVADNAGHYRRRLYSTTWPVYHRGISCSGGEIIVAVPGTQISCCDSVQMALVVSGCDISQIGENTL